MPVDSSNAIAFRGDAAAVASLIGVAQELDRRAESGSEIRVVFLEHADAEQLLPVLQQLIGQAPTQASTPTRTRRGNSRANGAAPGAQADSSAAAPAPVAAGAATGGAPIAARNAVVTRFEGANAIVIAASPDVQRSLGEVIRQLDVRREQVLVEAIIVEISDVAAQRLGVQLFLSGLQGSNIPFAITNYSNINPNLGALAGASLARELGGDDDDGDDRHRLDHDHDQRDRLGPDRGRRGQLAGINGGVAGLARAQLGNAIFGAIINAVRSDNRVEHPVDAVDHDARQSGGAASSSGRKSRSPPARRCRTISTTPSAPCSGRTSASPLEVRPQINAGGTIKLDPRVRR